MAANSDGYTELSAILTCEGDLSDPRFPTQLNLLVNSLNNILGESVKVHKLEPWNSVRVTLSIPREAALRLRQLANEGSQHLRALGILSVQVEGDQVISLRIATGSEPQEIILRTSQDGSSSSSTTGQADISTFLQTNATSVPASSNNVQVQFKSPNVVCPPDTVVPKVGANTVPPNNVAGSNKPFAGPFPFTSMNQAIHSNRETPFNSLPPPYPAKHPPVTISSPLLVNLLQNDGGKDSGSGIPKTTPPVRTLASSSPDVSTSTVNSSSSSSLMSAASKPISSTQAISSSISPSALTTNTSIRQNSTVMTSTTGMVNKTPPPPPPPQYHRALSNSGMVKQAPGVSHHNMNTISSAVPNSSFSQNTIMSRATQSTAVPLQQNNIYQQQLVNTSTQLKTPIGQPSVATPKHLISQQPVTSPTIFAKGPTAPLMKTVQQRTAIPNMLNNTHPKLLGAQSLPKNPNIYLPQQIKSNYPQSTTPIMPQTVATPSMSSLDMPSSGHNFNNVALRSMPSPPPYSVAISRPWDSLVNNSSSLMDLTPTLTDLKPDDLDALLPSLENELTQSPLPDLPEDFLADHSSIISTTDDLMVNDNRKFLINPLTGELEPQSSGESDTEELKDVFTGLLSPANLSDEDTCSTTRPDTTTDQSDSETRSSDTNKPQRLKNSKTRDRGRDSPALKPEKIKLRLKLEKSEPINPAYKVDVSFINQQPKKGTSSLITAGEELRVPPLHISLRGRNSAVIKNKNKLNPDGTPVKLKVRKNQDHQKMKKNEVGNIVGTLEESGNVNSLMMDASNSSMLSRLAPIDQKKFKKLKANHEHKDVIASLTQESDLKSKFVIHNHYKDKQKERRGSDSDLVKTKKFLDENAISDDKKRRLSQSELPEDDQPVLGSTNVGTIAGLPQKIRKDKVKIKDVFKKDSSKNNKIFNKNFAEKLQTKMVTLPTAGEMNMEAKFKQGLLEGTGEKGIPRPPHRTEIVNHLSTEVSSRIETPEIIKVIPEPTPINDKSPESDKCNTPNNRKSVDAADKPSVVSVGGVVVSGNGNRSPNSGGNQGEDSGIESMDALSEKSPNQASQSPHADILPPKTQVPNMLDIEAQLAKMEGLNGDSDRIEGTTTGPVEDVNENKCHQDLAAKCCELTCVLQDNIKQDLDSPTLPTNKQSVDSNLVSHKVKKDEDDLEPLPVRVTPALYTYSNPDKSRAGSESPALSDEDSNSCSTTSTLPGNKQSKSLLEQLLIEIPNDHQMVPSSPSPATRSSVRTRALSKLNSPELNSPVTKNPSSRACSTGSTKRKRNESDSSNQSLDETKKKSRRVAAANEASQTADSLVKRQNDSITKTNNLKKHSKVQPEESSDSDEPLSEKVRKTSVTVNTQAKAKPGKTGGPGNVANNNSTPSVPTTGTTTTVAKSAAMVVTTRRSVRSNMPAQNTRSKGETKVLEKVESDASRRKTRSTVSDVENKRKKEVK